MPPGTVEHLEVEYMRHGTQTLIANFEVTTGHVMGPSMGATRTDEDVVGQIACTIACDPAAAWVLIVDRLQTHQSESLVRFVAKQ